MASKQQMQQPTQTSLARRRVSSQSLDPLQMPSNICYETVSVPELSTSPEIVEEGKLLFKNFVVEEIARESPQILKEVDLSSLEGYQNPLWAKTGRDLRLLADEFAETKERQRVRQRADGVDINVTVDEFKDMLTELFLGNGVTRERIVVLFYFCSDVTIRFLKAGKDKFQLFMTWCLSFIVDKVCEWVQSQGGWSQVVRSPFNSKYKMAFWGTAITVVLVFVCVRYWRSPWH